MLCHSIWYILSNTSHSLLYHTTSYHIFSCNYISSLKRYRKYHNKQNYVLQTPCLKNPCDNNGRCIPRYQDDMYKCSCVAGYTGNHCQTGEKIYFRYQLTWGYINPILPRDRYITAKLNPFTNQVTYGTGDYFRFLQCFDESL